MILLGSEGFTERGGWTLDSQFIDEMGSAYLLAHGLGMPVKDAVSHVNAESKVCRLWVRTRDWADGAGRFRVVVNGNETGEFGAGEESWRWVDGGSLALKQGTNEVRLRDLTGFEGRCAGIAFAHEGSSALDVQQAWDSHEKNSIRNRSVRDFDFVVIGGGYAGMCAAVAAARNGVKTALVQDRPVWGGNASSEVRVGPIGGLGLGPFPRNSDLAYELLELTHVDGETASGGLRPVVDDRKLVDWLAKEKNLTTYISTRCVDCTMDQGVISSVICRQIDIGVCVELRANHFADCTGDAVLAALAGAEFRDKQETRAETGEDLALDGDTKGGYGNTNFWTTRWTDKPMPFPSCPWALNVTDENWQVSAPRFAVEGNYPYAAGWNWESGFGKDAIKDAEWIRDYNLRAAYGMWDYLKNKSPDKAKYANAEIDWLGFVLGKRASRRILGDYVLCEQDLTGHRVYEDGVVTTTWFLDLHFPHPMNVLHFPDGPFRSMAYDDPKYLDFEPNGKGRQIRIQPYPIPFRCFYSKNVRNLWMAGRDISCTHVAMSSVRVMNTTAQMGTMIGRAVSVCLKNDWSPRDVGGGHFDTLCRALRNPGRESALARQGKRRYQRRVGFKNEIKYLLRQVLGQARRAVGVFK